MFFGIPLALARFIENNGWLALRQNYPYWYFGTTPFYYLTGPVLPGLLVFVHRLLPGLELEVVLFALNLIFWIMGAVGVYWWQKNYWAAWLFGLGILMPLFWPLSDGWYLPAFSLLPWWFGLWQRRAKPWLLVLILVFLLLLNTQILPALVLGSVILLAVERWRGRKKMVKIWLAALLIVTLWYTPGYWRQLLLAPSFAGKPLVAVIGQLLKLLPLAVVLVVAPAKNRTVAVYWLAVFGWLTLLRFIADPDFWQDWTAYYLELQLGLALLLGALPGRWWKITLIGIGVFICFWRIKPVAESSYERQLAAQLNRLVRPGETVFLSGSAAFWLNRWEDIRQVRGGVDQASVDRRWRALAWEVREGENGRLALNQLRDAGIDWLVVHTRESREHYHDYQFPEKFEVLPGLTKIIDADGDRIYRLD